MGQGIGVNFDAIGQNRCGATCDFTHRDIEQKDGDLENSLFACEKILTLEPYNEKAKSHAQDVRIKMNEMEKSKFLVAVIVASCVLLLVAFGFTLIEVCGYSGVLASTKAPAVSEVEAPQQEPSTPADEPQEPAEG